MSALRAICASLIGIVALAACGTAPVSPRENRLYLSSRSDFNLPVASVLERRYQRVVRQQYDFSCGAAALATLLTYHYGMIQSEQSAFLGMWRDGDREQIRRVGFSLLEMKRYLEAIHVPSDGFRVTLDQIKAAAIPGIVLITFERYRHFVVLKAVDNETVLLGDPSLGMRRISRREFSRIWNGVYFALTLPSKDSFDLASDQALSPRAMPTRGFRSVDLQTLQLLRPNIPLGEL